MNIMLEWDHGKYCNNDVLGENSIMNYLVSCFFEKHSVVIANIWLLNHEKWC